MAQWAAAGMSMLPGLSPRPQHHIVSQKDITEEVNSTSNSMFVSVRECENVKVNVSGKVGKISLERTNGVVLTCNHRVVGGVLEIIKCQNVTIKLQDEAEAPTFQVDDSSNVTVEVSARSQIECIYYIRCSGLKLILYNQQIEGEEDASLQYDIPTEEDRAQIQQIAHWSAATSDASFVTEAVVRDGVYPTTAQMKKAADEKKQQMITGMASMLLQGIDIKKPEDSESKSKQESAEKDENLNQPD